MYFSNYAMMFWWQRFLYNDHPRLCLFQAEYTSMKFEVKEEIVETEEWSMDNVISESALKTENFSLAQVWWLWKLQFFIIALWFI